MGVSSFRYRFITHILGTSPLLPPSLMPLILKHIRTHTHTYVCVFSRQGGDRRLPAKDIMKNVYLDGIGEGQNSVRRNPGRGIETKVSFPLFILFIVFVHVVLLVHFTRFFPFVLFIHFTSFFSFFPPTFIFFSFLFFLPVFIFCYPLFSFIFANQSTDSLIIRKGRLIKREKGGGVCVGDFEYWKEGSRDRRTALGREILPRPPPLSNSKRILRKRGCYTIPPIPNTHGRWGREGEVGAYVVESNEK